MGKPVNGRRIRRIWAIGQAIADAKLELECIVTTAERAQKGRETRVSLTESIIVMLA